MGRVARWISSKIETYIEGIIESRINERIKTILYGVSGDDSPPLPNDRVLIVEKNGTGSYVACGVLVLSQGAEPGEKILYSRDSNGAVKSTIKLLSTGIIEINGNADFAVAFNDLKIEFNKLNDEYNKLVTRMLSWIPVPGDGGAALKASIIIPPSVSISGSNIDNAKVAGVKLP